MLGKDESGTYFSSVGNIFYRYTSSSTLDNLVIEGSSQTLTSGIPFSNYISLKEDDPNDGTSNGSRSKIAPNNVVFYGKKDDKIYFYYMIDIDSQPRQYSVTFGNIDEQISCKLLKGAINVCAFSQSGQVKLKILVLVHKTSNTKQVSIKKDEVVESFNNHEKVILYDTSNENYKILCAMNKGIKNIECLAVHFEGDYKRTNSDLTVNFLSINDGIQTSFSNTKDNCNATLFKDEYIMCCGKQDAIKCDRRNKNFTLINQFSIEVQGKISNLTLESTEDYVKLIYFDGTSLYEYFIYTSNCVYKTFEINSLGSGNLIFNDLFERKTNTKYYYIPYDIPYKDNDIKVTKINNQEMAEDDKGKPVLIEGNQNFVSFESIKEVTSSSSMRYDFFYFITNAETFISSKCQIKFLVNPCYESCKRCSIKKSDSSAEDHNCIECKEGYYPFSEKTSNCYTKEDVNENHNNWYFDENSQKFGLCHSSCKTCSGPLENNCLTCDDTDEQNPFYLYNGKCLNQCPEGTFITTDDNGKKICQNCHKNCKTCEGSGNADDMKCSSCPDNNIKYLKNCYEISNPSDKSFYDPEDNAKITSCFQLFTKYIKDNEYECIS